MRSKAKEPLGGLEESHACVSIPTDLEMRFSLRSFDVGRLSPNWRRPPSRSAMTAQWGRRDKAALSSGCKSHPATCTAVSHEIAARSATSKTAGALAGTVCCAAAACSLAIVIATAVIGRPRQIGDLCDDLGSTQWARENKGRTRNQLSKAAARSEATSAGLSGAAITELRLI